MANGIPPQADAKLLEFGLNFKTKTTATPTAYGLVALDASTFASKYDAFATALAVALAPETRSPVNVTAKNAAKADLLAYTRQLGRKVQGTASVTPAQKQQLGLSPRNTARTRIPVPGYEPKMDIEFVNGKTVGLRFHDAQNPSRRGRPVGVANIVVVSYVGENPPVDSLSDWSIEGTSSRCLMEVIFPSALEAGSKVYLSAYWTNPRGESGPACIPREVTLGGSTISKVLGQSLQPMRRAA